MAHINPSFPSIGDSDWGGPLDNALATVVNKINAIDDVASALPSSYVSFGPTAPNPSIATVWVDTSSIPQVVKGWSGTAWVAIVSPGGGGTGGTSYTDTQAISAVGAAMVSGTGIIITPNNPSNHITVTADINGLVSQLGIQPTYYYTGSSWPSVAVPAVPSGYTGIRRFNSEGYASAPSPTGMAVGDTWDRVKA